MIPWQIELSKIAEARYRELELFEKLDVFDQIQRFKIGIGLEGDFEEQPDRGSSYRMTIVSNSAISFVVNHEDRLVRILTIGPADR